MSMRYLIDKLLRAKHHYFDEFPAAMLSRRWNREIVEIWIGTGLIDYSLRKKTGENLIELAAKNNVKIDDLLLRED